MLAALSKLCLLHKQAVQASTRIPEARGPYLGLRSPW